MVARMPRSRRNSAQVTAVAKLELGEKNYTLVAWRNKLRISLDPPPPTAPVVKEPKDVEIEELGAAELDVKSRDPGRKVVVVKIHGKPWALCLPGAGSKEAERLEGELGIAVIEEGILKMLRVMLAVDQNKKDK